MPRAGSSSSIAPCYGPTAGPTERDPRAGGPRGQPARAVTDSSSSPVACPGVSDLPPPPPPPSSPPPPPPPPPPGSPGSSPSAVPGSRRRVRWGIGDVIAAFAVGVAVSVVAGLFVIDPDHPNRPGTLIVLICAQNLAIIVWLALVARRKGTGSLRSDFGLEIRRPAGRLVLRSPVAVRRGRPPAGRAHPDRAPQRDLRAHGEAGRREDGGPRLGLAGPGAGARHRPARAAHRGAAVPRDPAALAPAQGRTRPPRC